jgi:DNA polymerase-1
VVVVDLKELARKTPWLESKINHLAGWFKALADAAGEVDAKGRSVYTDKLINSPKQLMRLFFEDLNIPVVYKNDKGKKKVSLDRKALEKIEKKYWRAVPFTKALLKIRDYQKTLSVLENELWNGRWHCSYNICGTETGRRSSSSHPLGYGDNLQNKPKELRSMFVPDPGFIMVQMDQQQAESRDVAYLSGDENYIKAVESSDLHTLVASMVWGFDPKRELADRKFYRELTFRDVCKRLGHGSNYYGTAPTLSQQTGVELALVKDFQQRYHLGPKAAFPDIKLWQDATIAEIQTKGELTTCFGRKRQFWSRHDEDSTLREGIAYRPQSMTGERTALAIKNLYWSLEPTLQLLQDGHDAVLFQVPKENAAGLIEEARRIATIGVEVEDFRGTRRTQVVPWEVQTGYNWAPYDKAHPLKNPRGLR